MPGGNPPRSAKPPGRARGHTAPAGREGAPDASHVTLNKLSGIPSPGEYQKRAASIYTIAVVPAETGDRLDVGFARPGQTDPRYYQVSCRRTDGKTEVKSGPMVWEAPVKPGNYRLFVHTEGGALRNVRGFVTIARG